MADANARRWICTVESAAKAALQHSGRAAGPLRVKMLFRMPTAAASRHGAPHTAVPDIDNLAKLALDSMMRAGLIGDDSCVTDLQAVKVWSPSAGADFEISAAAGVPCHSSGISPPAWL